MWPGSNENYPNTDYFDHSNLPAFTFSVINKKVGYKIFFYLFFNYNENCLWTAAATNKFTSLG